MINPLELEATDDFTRAINRARRNFGTLEQSVGWLLQSINGPRGAGNGTAHDLAERLAKSAAAPGASERLIAFAKLFSGLVQEHDGLVGARHAGRSEDDIQAVGTRFESAGCEALALLTAIQSGSIGSAAPPPPPPAPTIDDSSVLAEFGRIVRTKLDANSRAFKMPAKNLELYVVRDFLPLDLCEKIIERINADLVPSGLLSKTAYSSYRTSRSCNFRHDDPLIRQVDIRIAELLGIPIENSEMMQGQRYDVGQEFKPHNDYFHKGEYYYEQVGREGGQRSWTAMIFLNTPEKGGYTNFPDAGVKIAPRAGNIVAWNNMDVYGAPNPYSLHQGMPVEAGSKWVITKWFRERIWGSSSV